MTELPHCCVGSSVVSIHTYLHTYIHTIFGRFVPSPPTPRTPQTPHVTDFFLLKLCSTHARTRGLPTCWPAYRLGMGRKWKHVLLRTCCSRSESPGIVAKANIHTLRVAGAHLRQASVHATYIHTYIHAYIHTCIHKCNCTCIPTTNEADFEGDIAPASCTNV